MALPPPPPVLHPLFVHFAIALIPASAASAAWYAWKGTPWTRPMTYALLTAAAVLSLMTMGSGFRDYFAVVASLEGTPARDVLEWHERLGVATAATVAGTALVAWWKRAAVAERAGWRWALALALGAATLLVVVTAWYGGSVVYDHGVNVARP